ncbi:MAG TPA: DMT family transporter [Patescibacteria group bacterium]|nr:DMT family transporter [Patescibacteria group bacterium]
MPWQLLTGISIITLSISVLLQRLLLHNDKSDPYAYVIIFQGLVAILIALYAIVHGFHMPDFGKYWLPIILTILLYGAGHVAYAHTLRQVEASIFSILFATSAIWTMFMGIILFHEHLNATQILGVILIFASVGLLAEHKKALKFDLGIMLGLLTGLLFGFATATWAYVGRHADAASWSALSFAGPSLVVLATHPKSIKKMKPFLSGTKLTRMGLLGVFFSISAVTLLTAYQRGNVSLIAPLQQTTIILTILLAVLFLKEHKHLWRKGLAAAVCFIGVLLIV